MHMGRAALVLVAVVLIALVMAGLANPWFMSWAILPTFHGLMLSLQIHTAT